MREDCGACALQDLRVRRHKEEGEEEEGPCGQILLII